MGKLTVIEPLPVTEAILTSTNVPETDYGAWAAGTTYALGARVIRTATHLVYQSLVNGNVGNTPESAPDKWGEVGATNRWSMFDGSVSRSTAQPGTISVTLHPGIACNALAAINIVGCTSIRVRVQDATYGTLYDKTTDMLAVLELPDWWSWFFGRRRARTLFVARNIPHLPSADIIVDFTGGADLAVGVLLIGVAREMGFSVRQGVKLGISDYSRKKTSDYGDVFLKQGAFAKKADFEVMIARAEVDPTCSLLAALRATPALWIASESYESTVIYGFYKDFTVLIPYRSHSVCTLAIEGLT